MAYQPQPLPQAHHLEVYYLELQILMAPAVKWCSMLQWIFPPFVHVGKTSSTANGDRTTTVTAGATSTASSTISTGTSSGGILSRAADPHGACSEMV